MAMTHMRLADLSDADLARHYEWFRARPNTAGKVAAERALERRVHAAAFTPAGGVTAGGYRYVWSKTEGGVVRSPVAARGHTPQRGREPHLSRRAGQAGGGKRQRLGGQFVSSKDSEVA